MICVQLLHSNCLRGNAAYLKKNVLWMKTMHYPNTKRSHLVTIVPMAPFAPKSKVEICSAHLIFNSHSRTNAAQS